MTATYGDDANDEHDDNNENGENDDNAEPEEHDDNAEMKTMVILMNMMK